jgi:hypothetical protein
VIHDRVLRGYLREGVDKYFRQKETGLTARELKDLDFDTYMRRLAFPMFRQYYPALKSEYPDLPEVQDPDELYRLSSMYPHLETLGAPFLTLMAYDDPVLSPADHFERPLRTCPNPLVDGIILENGGHLGFDTVTDTPFTSRVALEYFRYWTVRGG